jgi:alkylation response protein AidB-like acyl-CoA dehydrogenase
VSARSGAQHNQHNERDRNGVSLFVLPADTPGITITGYRTLDGLRAADVRFENVAAPAGSLLGAESAGGEILDAALDYGAGLLCFEALGAMEALFEATLEYLKTRQQFGVPIGKFQALQHRMADMYIHLEQARSMALLAAVKLSSGDSGDTAERRRAVSAAKYRINQAARFVGQQAVQLHGGMGVTDELPAAHYFKRLAMIELTLGDADHHLARFIAQPGFAQAEAA